MLGKDIANIRNRPKYIFVYKVMENDKLQRIILPIYGYGLWSTLYGFVSLGNDLQSIQGITFYEHGETRDWVARWITPDGRACGPATQAFDDAGNVAISVIKGQVNSKSAKAKYQVDGLSGATITTRGLDNMLKYWLGNEGYGRFLDTLKQGGVRG